MIFFGKFHVTSSKPEERRLYREVSKSKTVLDTIFVRGRQKFTRIDKNGLTKCKLM